MPSVVSPRKSKSKQTETLIGTNSHIQYVSFGYETEESSLSELIKRCVSYGESNSILVIGPRGCGKSTLLRHVLEDLCPETAQASVVKLHGLLQTDDNLALEEITRQLNLENVLDGAVIGSFEEKLQFLLQSLRSGSKKSQPVVFVIEEFDLFAHHKSQTLLYNLFDVSQSKQTPICVIGLTCRLDVIELLEKRVKSRFSHRFIHMFKKPSFSDLSHLLTSHIKYPSTNTKRSVQWNTKIDELIQDPTIKDALMFRFEISSDLHSVKNLALVLIAIFSQKDEGTFPEQRDFLEAFRLFDTDPKASMIQGVSVLELCLIIAMKHLKEIYSDEPFNFQMVYDHYRKFASNKSSMKTFPKAVAMKGFEHLIDLEIIKPLDQTGNVNLKQYRPMRLLVSSEEIDEAVQHYTGCPSDIKQWASSDYIR